jgi:hypothetical protein
MALTLHSWTFCPQFIEAIYLSQRLYLLHSTHSPLGVDGLHGQIALEVNFCFPMKITSSLVWLFMPVIPALRKLTRENHQFKATLGYIVRLCLKKTERPFEPSTCLETT